MPPHTFTPDALARSLYLFTSLAVAGAIAWAGLAGARNVDPECRGNSPHKICPKLTPADGATVSANVNVAAVVPDSVAGITFKVNDTPLALEDVTAPYELQWDTTKLPNGSHKLSATARDASGKTSTREHVVNVSNSTTPPPSTPPADTTPPSVQLSSPAAGATVSGQVAVAANVSDDVAVLGVRFKLDGVDIAAKDTTAPYSVTWDTTKASNGTHTLTAVAWDTAGNSASSERSVNVSNSTSSPTPPADTTAPSVQLSSPAAGATVSGSVSVVASASDNVGVVGVQFKLDGVNLGSEDTSSPYSVSWDTTKTANGSHTLTAVARDAAGNSASSERSVNVSNSTSSPTPPADTTAPSVQLSSPAAGATVSGSVSVVASASDNVGVVGVQFKLDGVNLGSEDTSSPYSVSWDTTKTANGSHTLTAVARDAAGNSASSPRSVNVSNTASAPSSGPKLSWAPPTLTNPVTINVTNANRRLFLDNSRDYRLNITETLRELWIEGGRNVVVIGGQITIDQLGSGSSYGDNLAVKVRFGDASGTVHLEGLRIDGAYVLDGIGIATGRNVQIQNVRVERAHDDIKGAHADCVQIQQGVGHLRMDRFTCTTERQGIFLGDHNGAIRSADLRRVNMFGAPGKHLFWQTNPTYPVSLSDFWLAIASGYQPWAPFGYWPYPQENGLTWDGKTDLTRRTQVSSDGTYLTFVGSSNTISGRINKGVPSGGDFVPRSAVGASYVSPGY